MVTETKKKYLNCIKEVLPENCIVQVQANLASFIERTDNAVFQNELYRNVDFIITDLSYRPLLLIEINDSSHNRKDRQERDEKVRKICEEAGIAIIRLWTSYEPDPAYIKKRITEELEKMPIKRVHHFVEEKEKVAKEKEPEKATSSLQATDAQPIAEKSSKKNGCYVATCVYGSYDCPQVWTLRRFRDDKLRKTWLGRIFIKVYYVVSPTLVKMFGDKKLFYTFCKKCLDALVLRLQSKGIKDSPYTD